MNKQEIQSAVEALAEQGELYIKTSDIADYLDRDLSTGKRGHIGRILNDLENTERWGKGKNLTWRIIND